MPCESESQPSEDERQHFCTLASCSPAGIAGIKSIGEKLRSVPPWKAVQRHFLLKPLELPEADRYGKPFSQSLLRRKRKARKSRHNSAELQAKPRPWIPRLVFCGDTAIRNSRTRTFERSLRPGRLRENPAARHFMYPNVSGVKVA